MNKSLILLSVLFCSNALLGQFNVKIGYGLAYTSASDHNFIIQSFNDNNEAITGFELVTAMPDLKALYGIVLGARYKLGNNNAIELTWESISRERSTLGINPDESILERDLFYSFNQFLFGYQSQFGNWGIGTAIGLNRIKIKKNIDGTDKKSNVVPNKLMGTKANQYVARVNLSYNIQSNRSVTLSIQPFYQIPLTDINIFPLANELGVAADPDNTTESFPTFGLTLLFYNGRQ